MLSVVAALARPSRALAGAVPPAPTSCPGGTHGVTGHAGAASQPPALPLAAGVMVCLGAWARRCKVRC